MLGYIKLAAAGLGIAAILALAYTYHSRGQEVKDLTKENANLTTQNEGLKDTVDTTQKSGAITDQTVAKTGEEKEQSRGAHEDVDRTTEREVEEIRKRAEQAANKPPAQRPSNLKDPTVQPPLAVASPTETLDAAVSKARIEGQWAAYCINVPTNPKCVKPTPAVAK